MNDELRRIELPEDGTDVGRILRLDDNGVPGGGLDIVDDRTGQKVDNVFRLIYDSGYRGDVASLGVETTDPSLELHILGHRLQIGKARITEIVPCDIESHPLARDEHMAEIIEELRDQMNQIETWSRHYRHSMMKKREPKQPPYGAIRRAHEIVEALFPLDIDGSDGVEAEGGVDSEIL